MMRIARVALHRALHVVMFQFAIENVCGSSMVVSIDARLRAIDPAKFFEDGIR